MRAQLATIHHSVPHHIIICAACISVFRCYFAISGSIISRLFAAATVPSNIHMLCEWYRNFVWSCVLMSHGWDYKCTNKSQYPRTIWTACARKKFNKRKCSICRQVVAVNKCIETRLFSTTASPVRCVCVCVDIINCSLLRVFFFVHRHHHHRVVVLCFLFASAFGFIHLLASIPLYWIANARVRSLWLQIRDDDDNDAGDNMNFISDFPFRFNYGIYAHSPNTVLTIGIQNF